MKNKRLWLLASLFLVVFVFTQGALGQTDRFIIDGADAASYLSVVGSSDLLTAVSQVAPRVVVSFANALKNYPLIPLESGLQNLIIQLNPRFIIEFANASAIHATNYPFTLINDNTPPVIQKVHLTGGGWIRWETDEYADGEIQYGTQPGVYSHLFRHDDYTKVHQFSLGITAQSSTFYFKINSTDRSGNTASIEGSAEQRPLIFLPLLIRR